MFWKKRDDKPEMNKKMLIVNEKGVSMRTYTENTPLKQVMFATKCKKWAYIEDVLKVCDKADKE